MMLRTEGKVEWGLINPVRKLVGISLSELLEALFVVGFHIGLAAFDVAGLQGVAQGVIQGLHSPAAAGTPRPPASTWSMKMAG